MISATLSLDIAQAMAALNQFGDRVRGLSNLGNIVRGVGSAFQGATAPITAFFDKMRSTMEVGAQLEELSVATGQSVRDLVVLRKAFELSGQSADDVGPMIARMQKSLAGVNEQGEPTAKVFDRLGLSIGRLRSMNAVEQLRTLQSALAKIQDPAERTKAAMDIFGKGGFKMGALLGSPETLDLAEKKAGKFGQQMEASAPALRKMRIAVAELESQWKKFYANILVKIGPNLQKLLEGFGSVNLGKVGASVGSAIAPVLNIIGALRQFLPVLKAIAIQFVMVRVLGSATFAALRAEVITTSIAFRSAGLGAAIKQIVYSLSKTSTVSGFFAMMRKGLNAISAQALVATAAVMAIMWGVSHYSQRSNSAALTTYSGVAEDNSRKQQSFTKDYANIAGPEEQRELIERLNEELTDTHRKIETVDEDFKNLGWSGWAKQERAEITENLQDHAKAIQVLINRTHEKTNADMQRVAVAQAVRQEEAAASKEAAESIATLNKELKKLLESYDEWLAKSKLEALPLDQQRQSILDSFGPGIDENSIAHGIDVRRDTTDPGQLKVLERLIEAAKALDEIQKKRAESVKKVAEAESEHSDRVKQLRAELSGNEERLRQLKAEQKLRERIKQLKDSGMDEKDAAKKAQEEIGLEESVDANKRRKTLEEYQRKYAQDMKKIQAETSGNTAAKAEIELQEKIDQYEKDAIDNGVDPKEAKRMAEKKARAEMARDAQKENKQSSFADSDRRVGLGGIGVGSRTDPLLKAQQEARKAVQDNTAATKELTSELKKKPERIIVPGQAIFKP